MCVVINDHWVYSNVTYLAGKALILWTSIVLDLSFYSTFQIALIMVVLYYR